MTSTPCSHCNVSLVCSLCLGAFTTLRTGQIEINIHFCIPKNVIFILFPWKNTFFSLQMFTVAHTVQYLENTILDKNVKKNARCMCNLKILPSKARFTQDTPPSSPKKQCWSVARTFLLPTKQHWPGRGGGGVTMVPNSQGRSPVCRKDQNS